MINQERMTRLAVIPARGGSTRLKDKNIFPLAGKPLISYTIEAVLNSKSFDTVIVSTDSPKIADVAKSYSNVIIHSRPENLAGSRVTVLEAMMSLMAESKEHDIFSYFLPTCPFRNALDIKNGLNLLDRQTDSVVSISKYSEPPQIAMVKRGDDIIPVFDNLTSGITNTLFMTPYYRANGGFYMAWWKSLIQNQNFYRGRVKGYEIEKNRSVDINDELDMKFAELRINQISVES